MGHRHVGFECQNIEYTRTIYINQCKVNDRVEDGICKTLYGCYFESDDRCMCTLLLPYSKCNIDILSNLDYLSIPLRCINEEVLSGDKSKETDLVWIYAESSGRSL